MINGGETSKWGIPPNRSELNKAIKKIVGRLAKSEADLKLYTNSLASGSIRSLRLIPYSRCTNDKSSDLTLSPICGTNEDIGGGGSFFSFRTNEYSPLVYSDIALEGSEFFAYGSYSTSFFSDLGEIPFESVGMDHDLVKKVSGIKYLDSRGEFYKLTVTDRFSVRSYGAEFRNYADVIVGHTYIIRSIAYNAGIVEVFSPMSINFGTGQDKRLDQIVVFKVLAREVDGSLTLVWKRLSSTKAPKLV